MARSDNPSPSKRSKTEDNDSNTDIADIDQHNNSNESQPAPNDNDDFSAKNGVPDAPKEDKDDGTQRPARHNPDAKQHGVQSENKSDDWKYQAPYKIHEKGSFDAKYEASCHCGKVQFQINREKPLDAKYCHCLTCQRLHGMSSAPLFQQPITLAFVLCGLVVQLWYGANNLLRRTLPVGCHFPQDGFELHSWSP
jgi:hypothetical protein